MIKINNNKKILVFIPEFPVLTETFIARDLEKLVQLGNLEITIVYLKKGKGEIPEILKPHAHKARLNVIDLLFSLRYFFTKSDKIWELQKIIRGDLTKSTWGKFYLLVKALGYANILKNYQPSEVHAHFYSDFPSLAMFVAIILDRPFSITAHARDVLEYPHLPKTKAKKAKFISVCNQHAYRRLMRISEADESKVHLIHHGIDSAHIFPKEINITKPGGPMIFMGGTRLTEKKGIEYMIEASKILKDRGFKHEVYLVGPGPLYEKLQQKISELALEETFYIKGQGKGAPFSEIAQYYLIADLFVLPIVKSEYGDADGIPNTIIEAALAKLPIITTDAGSVTELIIDDVTGVIVPQRNSEILATEIERLLLDQERKQRLGNAVYLKAQEMFDQETNVKKLESLLLLSP